MNRILLFMGLAVSMIAATCNKPSQLAEDCQGPADPNRACYEIYQPVCGCDQKTYPNDCYALAAGVKKWVDGACQN